MEALATLEYAKVDPSAEMLRRRVRRIVAWVTIAYASGCLATLFVNYRPLLMNVGSPGGIGLGLTGLLLAALVVTYPLMIVAGGMLLLEKPWAMALLRVSVGMILASLAISMMVSFLTMRGSSIPDLVPRQILSSFTSACLPVLVALLPLQARRAG